MTLEQEKLSDPSWRWEHLYWIVDKNEKKIKLKLNSVQRILAESEAKKKIILKARQHGVSTSEIIKLLDHTIWNRNVTTCIMAHEQGAIEKLFRIVKRAHDFMIPKWKPELGRGGGSKYEYFFPGVNSRIYVDLESRGDTINRLHVSEFAFMKNKDRFNATVDAVPLNGYTTIESTANGMNHMREEWNNPDSIYEKFFFPWYIHEEYRIPCDYPLVLTEDEVKLIHKASVLYGVEITDDQINFRRYKIAEKGRSSFLQEYPEDDETCFLSSGGGVFDLVKLKLIQKKALKPIEENETTRIFKPYDKTKHYVLGCDVAEGIGGDFSVISVFCANDMEQVAHYRANIKPGDFADAIEKMALKYSKPDKLAEVVVERNNHGHAVLLALMSIIRWPNIYHSPKDERPGWLSDRITRPLMVDTAIEGIENQTVTINDKETFSECSTLVETSGKIQANTGKHDDSFIATAIAIQICIKAQEGLAFADIGKKIRI